MQILLIGTGHEPELISRAHALALKFNTTVTVKESHDSLPNGLYGVDLPLDKPSMPSPLVTPYITFEMSPNYTIPEIHVQKTGEKISKYARPMVSNAYQGTPRNQTCPCGSGKKYKKCCQTQT